MKALYQLLTPVRNVALRILEVIVCVILLVLVLDVLLGVFTRFVLGQQIRWTEELAIYLLIWVSFLGAAVAYADNSHLGVDYVVEKFPPAMKLVAHKVAHVVVILFALYGMLYGGYSLVTESAASGQISAAVRIPLAWVYVAAPLTGAFFILFGVHALLAPANEDHSPAGHNPEVV